jgi:hypothetical protein
MERAQAVKRTDSFYEQGTEQMTWIKTVRMEDDERVRLENGIVGSHSLIPEALFHAFSTFGALMSPELPLRRDQHEMIATMVSVTNRCFY